MEDDNKKLVDELFGEIERTIRLIPADSSKPLRDHKVPAETGPVIEGAKNPDSGSTTFRSLIDGLMSDYDSILGLNLGTDLRGKNQIKLSEVIDSEIGLPFIAAAMVASTHFAKHLDHLSKTSGVDLKGIGHTIVTPALTLCAGIAMRIHCLPAAIDVTHEQIDKLSTSRLNHNDGLAYHAIEVITGGVDDNRTKWIGVLCYDVSLLVQNIITSVFTERSKNPAAHLVHALLYTPMFARMSASYTTNTLEASQKLREL